MPSWISAPHAVVSDPTRRVDGRLGGPVAGSILDCPLDVAGNGYRVCHVDGYADDAEFVRSVLDRFGEESHIRILESRRGTLTEAIADEQPPGEGPCELFNHWRAWMRDRYGLGG